MLQKKDRYADIGERTDELSEVRVRMLIREVRRQRGVTQAQLAARLGKSRSAIAMYETGHDIPWSVLVAIARCLDVDVNALWTDAAEEGLHTSPAIRGRPPRAAVHALPPRRRASRAKY
jgi:transcriptional regulator with XRE-family HTH domain